MKITFLTPSDNLSGGTRVIAAHARALLELGHEVLVVSNAPERLHWADRWRREWCSGHSPTPAATQGHIALSGVPHRVLERHRPIVADDLPDADIVVATWWETAVWMHALPRAKGANVHLIQGYETWVAGTHERVHAALRLPNHKVVISGALACELERAVGPLPLRVVPNAVDLQLFDAAPRGRQPRPTVGFTYASAAMKGSDLALAALSRLRTRCPDLQVLALGEDPPQRQLPLPPGALHHRRPPQEALPGLYAACDAWLFSSRRDSFGLPMLEAMACRTPVVAVDVGAAAELLATGGGVLVPRDDEVALAQGLEQLLLGSDAAWLRFSHRAHARAHAYSWQDASRALLQVFEQALDTGDRRAA
ncbi:glycosyltransferase family 4 protein [Mitsuaria sp. WAJ17]|uniref:glycosyltransferase family 4 protein n=1 Tax=Mitsuaria sp. WAJ17 TaxID=2761452 RepID=UPI0015FFC9BC|nr:glycosyltransferase family 4 protein [Mitsuaria sp. WAJ17]MBB2487060.1 glycosyltransferase family 4 protein [Mitsuaria sp. WAJ17]